MRRRFQKRIYIPLPDEEARKVMFRIHFGTTGHNLTDEDYEYLARHTQDFSGSDIEAFTRHALNYPIRLLQRCHYFKRNEKGMWEMSTKEEGEAKDVTDLPQGEVVIPVVDRVSDLYDSSLDNGKESNKESEECYFSRRTHSLYQMDKRVW